SARPRHGASGVRDPAKAQARASPPMVRASRSHSLMQHDNRLATPVLDLAPAARAEGVVDLPGSKSISNRTLLLAALAEGETRLSGLLHADDTSRMIDALRTLGVHVDARDTQCTVDGIAHAFPKRTASLFLG